MAWVVVVMGGWYICLCVCCFCYCYISILRYSLPQGRVLGPILLLLYTQTSSQIIDSHSVPHSEFADDS